MVSCFHLLPAAIRQSIRQTVALSRSAASRLETPPAYSAGTGHYSGTKIASLSSKLIELSGSHLSGSRAPVLWKYEAEEGSVLSFVRFLIKPTW